MKQLTDEDEIPNGKYQGECLANVPASYLLKLNKSSKCMSQLKEGINGVSQEYLDALKEYIKENMNVLLKEKKIEDETKEFYKLSK
jgi:uncharacterized protein (DUF3820 family)